MRQFFKFMFASMVGVFLSIILFFIILTIIISSMVSSVSDDKAVKLESGSILHIYFKAPIQDRTSENPLEDFNFTSWAGASQPGLNEIIKSIDKAADDNHINGIYLDLSELEGGFATIKEIRDALNNFRKSKKFIYAYSDYYSQGSYYLASVADQVWVNPEGIVEFKGFAVELPFLKGMFEKIGVEPQVIRHGKFKSAIEPLILDKMSEENKQQVASYMNALWNHYLQAISDSRKISPQELQLIADSMQSRTSEDALRLKMVDKVGYKDEFLAVLKSKSDKKNIG